MVSKYDVLFLPGMFIEGRQHKAQPIPVFVGITEYDRITAQVDTFSDKIARVATWRRSGNMRRHVAMARPR